MDLTPIHHLPELVEASISALDPLSAGFLAAGGVVVMTVAAYLKLRGLQGQLRHHQQHEVLALKLLPRPRRPQNNLRDSLVHCEIQWDCASLCVLTHATHGA